MAKNSLEEKIKEVAFYAIIFLILYLIVGYLIQSKYLKCLITWDKSYDLLRDALTLTAYFITPATAFVLFSDWREQHVLITNERLSINILEKIIKLDGLLLQGYNIHAKNFEEWKPFEDNFIKLLKEIREEKEKLNLLNDDATELKSNLESLNRICSEYLSAHYSAVKYEREKLSFIPDSDLEVRSGAKAREYGYKSMKLGILAKGIIRKIKILFV